MKASVLVVLLVAVTLTGCDTSSDPESTIVKRPGNGSVFTYSYVDLNRDGSEDPSSRKERVQTLIDTAVQYMGRTCSESVWSDIGGPTYVNYPENGNIAVFIITEEDTIGWKEIPVATKDTREVIEVDSTSGGIHYQRKRIYSYVGRENIRINGTTLETSKMLFGVQELQNGSVVSTLDDWFWYYSPILRTFVKVEFLPSSTSTGSRTEMISFDIK